MANELSTTVKPQSKPMMKSMKPPLPSVLSPAVLEAVFLDLAGGNIVNLFGNR
jgi:hypothetical protein